MTTTAVVGGRVFTPDKVIDAGTVLIEGSKIVGVGPQGQEIPSSAQTIDASGSFVAPGLIDLHFYGCGGHGFAHAESLVQEIASISELLPRWGTTAFLVSPMAANHEALCGHLAALAAALQCSYPGAQPIGIHLEGPFLSPVKHGAFLPEWLREPNDREARAYLEAARGSLVISTMAPELPKAKLVARQFKEAGVRVSLGHSAATYEEASAALAGDFELVTHCFNAMRGFHHRDPGVVGAVLDSTRSRIMLICDGHHVHPAAVRILVHAVGAERLILVTDAMPAAGLKDGRYELLGQEVTVREGQALLDDATLAGSVLTMDVAVKNMLSFTALHLTKVLPMATSQPAVVVGLGRKKGRIARGYDADIILMDQEMRCKMAIVAGEVVYDAHSDTREAHSSG